MSASMTLTILVDALGILNIPVKYIFPFQYINFNMHPLSLQPIFYISSPLWQLYLWIQTILVQYLSNDNEFYSVNNSLRYSKLQPSITLPFASTTNIFYLFCIFHLFYKMFYIPNSHFNVLFITLNKCRTHEENCWWM